MPSTISLRNILDFTRTRTRMIQLTNVGGIPNQPGLDLCNDVLQTLLSAPNNWKFNKAEIPPFTTIPNQQDYWVSGCTANVYAERGPAGLVVAEPPFSRNQPVPFHKAAVYLNSALDENPGLRQLTNSNIVVADYSKFAPSGIQGRGTSQMPPRFRRGDVAVIQGAGNNAYNGAHKITHVPDLNRFMFEVEEAGLPPDGGQGINSLAWMERATLEDFLNTAFVKPKRDILAVSGLPQESIIQPPFKVCLQIENVQQCGQQALTELLIRFWPVPSSQIWRAFVFYQLKAPVKTSLDENWNPWPDDLAYVLRSGVYAKALDHGEDPRANIADAKWQQDIARALGIRQQEERHEAFFPDVPVLRGG
jgi:hypothetical protein